MSQQQIPAHFVTSVVLQIVLRVGGNVHTSIITSGEGTMFPQVNITIGDAMLFVADRDVMRRLCQQWDAQAGRATALPQEAPVEWVQAPRNAYPVTIAVRPTWDSAVIRSRYVAADPKRRQPPHVHVQLERIAFQVVDITAWRRIADILFEADMFMRSA